MTSIKVGTCNLCLEWKTKAFSTLSIQYSDEILLTPSRIDASVLYRALTLIFEKGDEEGGQIVFDSLPSLRREGATWGMTLPLDGMPNTLILTSGSLSLFLDRTRLAEILRDMKAVLARARALNPALTLELEHINSHTRCTGLITRKPPSSEKQSC